MAQISVIVPVYKVEAYLARCVESLLGQSFGDFRLILVDDGSPDRCGEICEEFARRDSRIQVLHRENGGLSAARNTGIDWALAHTHSPWLAFVDSDDWVDRTFLAQLHQAAEESGCLLSACGLYRTGGESRESTPPYRWEKMAADAYYCSPTVHGGVTAVAWNKLYHRSLFSQCRYPEGKLHEDEFTTYRLVYQAGEVAVVEGALYAYFQNQGGIMASPWSPRRLDALEAVEGQMAYAREKGLPNLERKAAKQYIYAIADQMKALTEEAYRPLLRKKLRFGLARGRETGVFPRTWQTRWAYELAYPCKPFWWLVGRLGRREGV